MKPTLVSETTLTAWLANPENHPRETMIWGKSAEKQFEIAREAFTALFPSKDVADASIFVAGTHRSLSINLPVYHVVAPDLKLELWARDNFYDWKVSVRSEEPLLLNPADLFDPEEEYPSCYCEGMSPHVFLAFSHSTREFTVAIHRDSTLVLFAEELCRAARRTLWVGPE